MVDHYQQQKKQSTTSWGLVPPSKLCTSQVWSHHPSRYAWKWLAFFLKQIKTTNQTSPHHQPNMAKPPASASEVRIPWRRPPADHPLRWPSRGPGAPRWRSAAWWQRGRSDRMPCLRGKGSWRFAIELIMVNIIFINNGLFMANNG